MRTILVKMVLGIGVFVGLAGAPRMAQAVDCLGIAGPSGFTHKRCNFKADDGSSSSSCAEVSGNAFLDGFVIDFLNGASFGCRCEATGSFAAPNFAEGKDFQCFPVSGGANGIALSGKVLGQKIKKGQQLTGSPPFHTFVFECAPDPLGCP